MGSCEHLGEPSCASSPLVIVASGGGGEEMVGEDVGGTGVAQSISEMMCSLESEFEVGTFGAGDEDLTNGCLAPLDEDFERTVLECGVSDGAEVVGCGSVAENLEELVLDPLSSLEISSRDCRGVADSAGKYASEQDCCLGLNNESSALGGKDGSFADGCPSACKVEGDCERSTEGTDPTCSPSGGSVALGNVVIIECGLSKMCFEGTAVKRETNSCSGMQQVTGACTDSGTDHLPDTYDGRNNPSTETLGEAVSDTKNDGSADDESFKSLVRPDDGLGALNGKPVAENASVTDNDGNGNDNARKDDETCDLKCSDEPLLLRRSTRSRKTVQQVQRGKRVSKCSKEASKVSPSQTINLPSEARRKRRSFLSRSACSSTWGSPESISKYFDCSKEAPVNQVLNEGTPTKKAVQRNKRNTPSKVVESSQLPEKNQGAYRPIRLKVTFGKKEGLNKEDMPTMVADSIAAVHSGDNHSELLVSSAEGNVMDSSAPLVHSASVSNVQFSGTKLDTCSMPCKSFQAESEKLGASHAHKFLDPGTSPDSEVIDQVLESTVEPNALLLNSLNYLSRCIPGSEPLSCAASTRLNKSKEDKNIICQDGNPVVESPYCSDKAKELENDGKWQKSNDFPSVHVMNTASENPSSNTSGSELVLTEPVADEGSCKAPSLDNVVDSNSSPKMIGIIEAADSGNSELLPLAKTLGKRNIKSLKAKANSRSDTKKNSARKNGKETSAQRKSNKKNLSNKGKVRETGTVDDAHQDKGQLRTGNPEVVHVSERVAPADISCSALPTSGVGEQTSAPRVAWVCCDGCLKWRHIRTELADAIEETNSKWFCKDNEDQAFADCTIPQAKSNAEINAELQISDEEDARDGHTGSKGSGIGQAGEPQQSTWMRIKSNLFLHRSRKNQTMDEAMVCHCKPPADGTKACGSQCLNRMLNIECVQGTCPCGDLCSNQQFQRRQYANLSYFRCGKKGYGLQVLEDIFEGQFLIEYVGEVLDLQSYEGRQKEYALNGHKHFYFMTLNGNEVIDASAKGNLGRFVNHSCDPNCRTEKWVVNGEICVGLFALRNIRKGEELTFDYNYVRVFGAAAKKCYCGARKCRGYIGGDPLNAEVVVQGESDDEFPEPVVIDENGEIDSTFKNMMVRPSSEDVKLVPEGDKLNKDILEVIPEVEVSVNRMGGSSMEVCEKSLTLIEKEVVDAVHESSDGLAAPKILRETNEPIPAVESLKSTPENSLSTSTSSKSDLLAAPSTIHKSLSSSVDSSGRMSEVEITEGEGSHPKVRPRMKISRPSKSAKNRRSSSSATSIENALLTVQVQKSQISPYKPKKLMEGSVNSHLETVEDKLNELLDADGGICKKKDASKGYLKLLLLTAASGDSGNGGAIQSNRELSMILDAILKTKSRGVLLDVVNKNGLQMLHNMLKLYRKDFKKTPILRKLLRVVEFLAEREILTVERIFGDPLRPGVESFRRSILNLTEHDDRKVHQIARNFRDKWLPRPVRRYNGVDNSDRDREFGRGPDPNRSFGACHPWREHDSRMPESIDCMNQSAGLNNLSDTRMQEASPQLTDTQTMVRRHRKRKSRWDQPADTVSRRQCKEQKIEPSSPHIIETSPKGEVCDGGKMLALEARKDANGGDRMNEVIVNSEDDAPPGFACLRNCEDAPPGFSSSLPAKISCTMECPSMVAVGLIQERFNSRLPVAYGIPFSVIQQFGTLKPRTVDTWAIAPAMPFQPFPPLPPYPHDKRARQPFCPGEGATSNGSREEMMQDNYDSQRGQGMPSTSGASLPHVQNSATANQNNCHDGRGPWNGPGRRHYKQKKWNNAMPRPPWLRNLDGRGFNGNHSRNRALDGSMEFIANEQDGQHLGDVYHSVDCAGNSW